MAQSQTPTHYSGRLFSIAWRCDFFTPVLAGGVPSVLDEWS